MLILNWQIYETVLLVEFAMLSGGPITEDWQGLSPVVVVTPKHMQCSPSLPLVGTLPLVQAC